MYYIKIKDKDLYLNIDTRINDQFNCINITLSKTPHLWVYNNNDKIIINYQTKGVIIHKYHGWVPETSNIVLLNDNTYDISFRGADDYNNPIRKLSKVDINSNKGCRVQHQITKEKAYSLSEIEL